MAILKPDKTTTLGGVTVNEYLLTNHNPNHIDMPSVSMEGKIIGVTVHNTDWITTAAGTTPAEQYTRATVNGNMKDVRVHYYCDDTCAWQNLLLTLSDWHAADAVVTAIAEPLPLSVLCPLPTTIRTRRPKITVQDLQRHFLVNTSCQLTASTLITTGTAENTVLHTYFRTGISSKQRCSPT